MTNIAPPVGHADALLMTAESDSPAVRPADVAPRIRQARLANSLAFMTFGASFYAWSTGVSALRVQTGLAGSDGDFHFGMIAFGIGVGSVIGSLAAGRLIDRFGSRFVMIAVMVIYALSFLPLGMARGYEVALVAGVMLGIFRGGCDTTLNCHGVQIEQFYGRSIMSSFHACFAFGGFLFGLVGSYFAGAYPNSPLYEFMVIAVICLLAVIALNRYFLNRNDVMTAPPPVDDAPHTAGIAPRDWRMVLLMVGFGMLLIATISTESAVTDWGQEFMRRHVVTNAGLAGIAISCFTGAEFLGRLVGDWAARRFGRPRTVVFSCGLTLTGIVLAIVGGSVVTGIVGFALLGLGVSCLLPLVVSAAGAKDPANQGRNIGIVFFVGYCGLLVGPAAFAIIVSTLGIGMLFALPIVLMIAFAILGPILMRTHA